MTIDGARVLAMSQKGTFGYVQTGDKASTELVEYMAVCKYPNDADYYLFLCNGYKETIQDNIYMSFDEAFDSASRRSSSAIDWEYF